MNTRRHPRTLNEAFPRTAAYACAVEVHTRPLERLAGIALAVVIGVTFALLVWGHM